MNPKTDFGWDKLNITTDTLVKTGQGILHSIVLNGVTTVGDVAIYDGIDNTGQLIATLNVRSAVSVSFQGLTFLYDCKIDTGIFVDINSSTFVGNLTATFI